MAITMRSGKSLPEPTNASIEQEDSIEWDAEKEINVEVLDDPKISRRVERLPGVVERALKTKEYTVEALPPLQHIPRPPHPFPQSLKKKDEDGNFLIHIHASTTISEYSISRSSRTDVNAIATRSLVYKKEEPAAFTIPCTIGALEFAKALHDLGVSICLMPLAIYK
ncbi:uncharacterized protein LOC125861564 [Solanum stenotomum]|uniref:uncharacterized protein LOC125861564 n=1 Tax=Solanum stenotomum TaxID=172797 RepID=UPI0020D1A6C0|nr:uncharacterized protein LOC125861564 [Solanum stenotomum]